MSGDGVVRRVRAKVRGVDRADVLRRAAESAEMVDVIRAERRVASLEVAVAENARLAVELERVVGDVERALLEVMERAQARRMGS